MFRAKTPSPPSDSFLNTLGIFTVLNYIFGCIPKMQWMSNLILDKVDIQNIKDPLYSLPPSTKKLLLELPNTAWITVGLFVVNSLIMLSIVLLSEFEFLYQWLASILLTFTMFIMFSVAHDASHGSISKISFVNGLVGRFAFGTMGPVAIYPIFRYVHQMHHKFTNDPVNDPDNFCAHGGYILLPVRCFLLVPYYFCFYLQRIHTRPILEVIEFIVAIAIQIGIVIGAIEKGYLNPLLFYWIIPSTFSHALLAFFFDFIPHHHQTQTPVQSRYHTTSLLQTYWFLQPVLTLLLQYQDYHIIHHLYPTIPFYKYADKWQEKQEFLINEKNIHVSQFTVERAVENTKSVATKVLS